MTGKSKTELRSIGEDLKAMREKKGWSIDQATHATRLRKEVVLKLEADRIDQLPNTAYARGFLRIYARELCMDVNAVLRRFDGMMDIDEELTELRPETLEILPERVDLERAKFQNVGLWIIGVIIIIAAVFGGIELYRIWPTVFEPSPATVEVEKKEEPPKSPAAKQDKPTSPAPAPKEKIAKATPVAPETIAKAEVIEKVEKATPVDSIVKKAEPVGPAAAASAAHKLQFNVTKEVSVKVVGMVNGQKQKLFEGIIPAGTTYPATSAEAWSATTFTISLSEASNVDIILDGISGKFPESGPQEIILPSN